MIKYVHATILAFHPANAGVLRNHALRGLLDLQRAAASRD
jgi:hypothetical protein